MAAMNQTPPRAGLTRCTTARLLRDRRGAAAVEFALLMPVLFLLLAGLIDVSRLITQSMQVRAAAQAGADHAQRHGWNEAAVRAAVTSATPLEVAADPAPQVVTACVEAQAIAPTTAATCAAGGKPGTFVRVAARAPFKSLMPWPGFALPSALTGQAVVRIQ